MRIKESHPFMVEHRQKGPKKAFSEEDYSKLSNLIKRYGGRVYGNHKKPFRAIFREIIDISNYYDNLKKLTEIPIELTIRNKKY
jgi:hypothetical protein